LSHDRSPSTPGETLGVGLHRAQGVERHQVRAVLHTAMSPQVTRKRTLLREE
jgi:hypothetical protein